MEVTEGTETKFVVKGNGQVGIGTESPDVAYMLDVKGYMRACEVRVNNASNWCDYVFAKNYALMPLAKLAAYIEENHHLPEMPSEAEVKLAGGFDVSEMTTALLQRSEENTLYILQLDENLSTLKQHEIQQEECLEEAEQNVADLQMRLNELETAVQFLLEHHEAEKN